MSVQNSENNTEWEIKYQTLEAKYQNLEAKLGEFIKNETQFKSKIDLLTKEVNDLKIQYDNVCQANDTINAEFEALKIEFKEYMAINSVTNTDMNQDGLVLDVATKEKMSMRLMQQTMKLDATFRTFKDETHRIKNGTFKLNNSTINENKPYTLIDDYDHYNSDASDNFENNFWGTNPTKNETINNNNSSNNNNTNAVIDENEEKVAELEQVIDKLKDNIDELERESKELKKKIQMRNETIQALRLQNDDADTPGCVFYSFKLF